MRMLHLGLRVTDLQRSLVYDPARPVADIGAVNHLVIQVNDLDATIADIAIKGITAEPPTQPDPASAPHGSRTPTATGSNSCSGHPAIPRA